ncbi:DedA family protein [Croceibacterium ferulae]|uniref:DedA family protein n=1 Tax=Croceibacterium ferulae TaxID=1854641 RepID=UPI000EB183AF|nr:DedA family protein [Croceibacterium ferulae]
MGDLLSNAATLLAQHQDRALPLLALLAFAECLVVVGVLFPATATMITVGGLIGAGLIDPVGGCLAAIAGATVSGWASYHLGRWMGPAAFYRWPFARHRSALAMARLFFRRHGVLWIFLARFYGPTRATIPLAAGMMNMRRRTFEIANAGSAVLWVVVLFGAGWLAEHSMDAAMLAPAAKIPAFLALALATSAGSTLTIRRILVGARRTRLLVH